MKFRFTNYYIAISIFKTIMFLCPNAFKIGFYFDGVEGVALYNKDKYTKTIIDEYYLIRINKQHEKSN